MCVCVTRAPKVKEIYSFPGKKEFSMWVFGGMQGQREGRRESYRILINMFQREGEKQKKNFLLLLYQGKKM